MASFVEFVRRLLEEGIVALRARPRAGEDEKRQAETILAAAYADHLLDVAGPPVPFDAAAAVTAAEQLGLACWFLLHRGDAAAEVEKCLPQPVPPVSAAQHLSADLVLRFAPQVHRRARGLDARDTLTRWLERLLRLHSLSGALADIEDGPAAPVDLDGHPGLLLLYAERLADHVRPAWVPQGPALAYVEMVFAERGLPLPPRVELRDPS